MNDTFLFMTSSYQSCIKMAPRSLSHVYLVSLLSRNAIPRPIAHLSSLIIPRPSETAYETRSGAGANKVHSTYFIYIHMQLFHRNSQARSRTARSARGQHMIVPSSGVRYRLAYVHHAGWRCVTGGERPDQLV
jgi:hypothetical protein